jgi:uncharacterized secreted protein with C-terminal beta-propeller domain
VPLPAISTSSGTAFPDIYYFDTFDNSYNYVNIIALNTQNDEMPSNKVYMLPSSQSMFVSADNIYLTYTKWLDQSYFFDKILDDVILPITPADIDAKIAEIRAMNISKSDKFERIGMALNEYTEKMNPEERAILQKQMEERMLAIQNEIAKQQERTVVHKISISGKDITYQKQGSVPGHVLNQFSMDESNDYFRIATTLSSTTESVNNLYILDRDLNQVGKIEDLAPGERIYSARFMGDRAYMVTFRQVDPLFVIDLKDPSDPEVLGFLKVTGFSDYLHPVDENHIIGIGRDATDQGRMQGMKMSLFDVTDVANPREISKVSIGDRETDSYALSDHKAFLFNKDKKLLVLPILLAEINESRFTPEQIANGWTYGDYKFQGAYVFDFTVDNGFKLRGKISHAQNASDEYDYNTYWGQYSVKRSLYMDNVLYTISDKLIKMNNLETLEEINKVELPGSENNGGIVLY